MLGWIIATVVSALLACVPIIFIEIVSDHRIHD